MKMHFSGLAFLNGTPYRLPICVVFLKNGDWPRTSVAAEVTCGHCLKKMDRRRREKLNPVTPQPPKEYEALIRVPYERGDRTWSIRCSCGWEWSTSALGTRKQDVFARARAHEKEHKPKRRKKV